MLYFKWDCSAPFKLTPENGLLKPGEECLIFVDFQPLEAKVFQQQAHCRFGEDGEKVDSFSTVLLQGIGIPKTRQEVEGSSITEVNQSI